VPSTFAGTPYGQYDIYDLALNVPGTPPPAPLNVIRATVSNFGGDQERGIPAAADVIFGGELIVQDKARQANTDSTRTFALGTRAFTEA
jgi:hypothetical protein